VGTATYRATRGALNFDAYYRDEWGVINDAKNTVDDATEREGFHKSRFTSTVTQGSTLKEVSATHRMVVENRANPHKFALKDKSNPVPKDTDDRFNLQLFASRQVETYWQQQAMGAENAWKVPVNITLFFAVGTELNRHGLRSFIEKGQDMQVVLLLPGIEPAPKAPRFGLAVNDTQIAAIRKDRFGMEVPYKLRVMACFSTGSCGMNQTLLNELVKLGDLKRLVFYDCLYSKQCGDTVAAIEMAKARAGSDLKIVVYKTSEGGNSFVKDSSQLAVVESKAGLIPRAGVIENLFQNKRYIALVIFRALEAAVQDKAVSLDKAQTEPFVAMQTLLSSTPRGSVISSTAAYQHVHGNVPASGVVAFDPWSSEKATAKVLDAFSNKVGIVSNKGSFRHMLWAHRLPGWNGGDGEDKHDLLLPEFGWEYLLY
jgi:hypothetical protein